MLSPEVIVALALGVPSLFVAVAALWIAYLAYLRQPPGAPLHHTTPSWPTDQYPLLAPNGGRGHPVMPQPAFQAEARPARRRPVELEA
ncbi:hypothetical protein PG993_009041 [Apiospora rasikravindrae]|uniref:Uncharacterized protein n=1 Tax=Apiospora rasikravindrae TaxID=990691 RepID=A0ABR1SI84_9PEZI